MYKIENDYLSISVSNYGAELHNITGKEENLEFLWNGNEEYWKYHAPVLFPIVGKVIDNTYTIDGEKYTLPQHGLARISNFKLLEQTANSLTFELKYNNDSLKVYPYKFSLIIKYALQDSTIKIDYTVNNLSSNKEMFFSIGAHPAFICPLLENEKFEDYYFEFTKNESCNIMELSPKGYFTHNEIPFLNNENKIYLSKELFRNDALVFKNLNSDKICLKSKNHNKSLEFDFSNFPYLGLWSKPTGSPFVCIEPWFGHADFEDFSKDFTKKSGIQNLSANSRFICSYSVTINQ